MKKTVQVRIKEQVAFSEVDRHRVRWTECKWGKWTDGLMEAKWTDG